MTDRDKKYFTPQSKEDWRNWLEENHNVEQSIWLVYYKAASKKKNLNWSEAVEEALCFGWIDSVKKKMDDERFIQFFSKRKPKSTWSKVNKEKIRSLLDQGRMREAGLECIKIAKMNGSWSLLDAVENLVIPVDLETELLKRAGAKDFFLGLSKSTRKSILQWITLAKREDTRRKRVEKVAEFSALGLVPQSFR